MVAGIPDDRRGGAADRSQANCRRSNCSTAGCSASSGSTAGSTASSACWRTRRARAARTAETEIAAGRYRGPLHGIPIGLKDIYETAGVATTGHSKVMQDHVPAADAFSVARLRAAGAVVVGKLATHEFAFGGPSFDLPWPPARNPWDTARFTGGSSSGTGAAVAAGLVLGGTGSDTGGSIRGPSAYCGLAGIKPTYGLISRMGILPLAFSLDHAGPMAWTAEDCAIMLQAMAGHDPADPASAEPADPGLPRGAAGRGQGAADRCHPPFLRARQRGQRRDPAGDRGGGTEICRARLFGPRGHPVAARRLGVLRRPDDARGSLCDPRSTICDGALPITARSSATAWSWQG